MTKLLRKTLAVAAACVAVGAHAEGLYVGGALTAPDYKSGVGGYGDGSGGSGPGFKLYGGWQWHPNWALEAGVFNLGRTNGIGANGLGGDAKAYGAFVDAVGRVEVAPAWSVLGSAGLAQGHLTTPGGSENTPALKLGVGLQYDLSRTTSLRLGYEHYKFNNAFDAKPSVGQTSLGVNMAF